MFVLTTEPPGISDFSQEEGMSLNSGRVELGVRSTSVLRELHVLMTEWLQQVSQWHDMYCYALEVMSSNPGWVKLEVRSISVLSRTWPKSRFNNHAKYKLLLMTVAHKNTIPEQTFATSTIISCRRSLTLANLLQ